MRRNAGHARGAATLGLLTLGAIAGCGSDGSPSGPSHPIDEVPDFIYVSNAGGSTQLYTWSDSVSTLFPASAAGDAQPQSASGKVVWTSHRISAQSSDIYIANLDGSAPIRLTTDSNHGSQPSLSPDGSTVAYTRITSSISRIWTVSSDGSNPVALATGSPDDLSESSARFSPAGDRILFSSPRTNTTQLFVMPAGGGAATQVTHEANGAFDGSWSADGNSIFYVDGLDRTRLRNVVVATGAVTDYVTGGTDVGDAACSSAACVVVSGATSLNGNILAYVGTGAAPISLLNTADNEFEPAILRP